MSNASSSTCGLELILCPVELAFHFLLCYALLGTISAGTIHCNAAMQPYCNTVELFGIPIPVKPVKSPVHQGAIDMDMGNIIDCLFI